MLLPPIESLGMEVHCSTCWQSAQTDTPLRRQARHFREPVTSAPCSGDSTPCQTVPDRCHIARQRTIYANAPTVRLETEVCIAWETDFRSFAAPPGSYRHRLPHHSAASPYTGSSMAWQTAPVSRRHSKVAHRLRFTLRPCAGQASAL